METKIKWQEGEGHITVIYEGSGNGPASIASDENEGLDREQTITIETTAGAEPKSASVIVKQEGMREEYVTADGEVYMTADGNIYGCLK